ncbi:hypothetical protein L1987_08526 [Smallanthus sonchifolius]|uniref:Uncharacterized protein n=1 Tax=Smallanthus sonchifolius TaxID=185202 RepID=A0ACB9JN55_9ASTR|nr:hypothetical protein L1987_08526 [Smallanthus sonchifolius]
MARSGVPVTSETTSYEEPDYETNIQEEIMQEDVIINKQMTMVEPLPCNSDSRPVTKHISELFYGSHKPRDRAHHSKDHFSWKKQRSSNEDYVTKKSYRAESWTSGRITSPDSSATPLRNHIPSLQHEESKPTSNFFEIR